MGKEIKEVTDLPGIGAESAKKLKDAGYKTVESIAVASPIELVEIAGLGDGTAEKAIKAARDALEMGFESASVLAEKRKMVERISTGSKELDSLIGGGVETQSITEVYGKFASGKCVAKDTQVFYFNPDKAHLKTIEEMYKDYAVNEAEFDGGFIADLKRPVSVPGIDFNGQPKIVQAKRLFKEHVKELLEIKTERGTKINLTQRHPLLTINGEGIQWKSSGLLKEGDFIGSPKEINFDGKNELTSAELKFVNDVSTRNEFPLEIVNNILARIYAKFGIEDKKIMKQKITSKHLKETFKYFEKKVIEKQSLDNAFAKDLATINTLANDTIRWEKINSIKNTEYDDWVYDLEVPEIHSFIGGNKPLFLHNSQWCFQLCVMAQLPKDKGGLEGGVLYIDSENSFRPERVIQVARHLEVDEEQILKNIFVARAYNADHQMLLAEKATEMIKEKNIKLVIVDSLTAQFRSEYLGRGMLADRQQKLNKHMRVLQRLAELNNVALLVTNQVMENPGILFGDPTTPIGGNIVGHSSKTRLYLRKSKEDKRVAKLVDSPSLPDGEALYRITENGIEDV